MHHLCEQTGFAKIGEVSLYSAPSLPEPVSSFRPLAPEQVEAAAAFARQSESLRQSGGLIDLGWVWANLAEGRLAEAVDRKMAWLWRPATEDGLPPTGEAENGILVIWDETEDGNNNAYIQWMACDLDAAPALLGDFRRLAAQLSSPHITDTLSAKSSMRE